MSGLELASVVTVGVIVGTVIVGLLGVLIDRTAEQHDRMGRERR